MRDQTSYKPDATAQLTIRRLHVYHVTRYLWQNYILSKRVALEPIHTRTRVSRARYPPHGKRTARSTWRRTGSSSLSFPRSTYGK